MATLKKALIMPTNSLLEHILEEISRYRVHFLLHAKVYCDSRQQLEALSVIMVWLTGGAVAPPPQPPSPMLYMVLYFVCSLNLFSVQYTLIWSQNHSLSQGSD